MYLNFFLSLFPILLLIYLMTKRNGLPSYKALPIIGLLVIIIQVVYWGNNPVFIGASVFASLISTLVPVTIIFGAILFNRYIEVSGSINVIKSWLANITPNPTAQLMIIGWAFAFMIEGASGFGTPAAIAAPLLVSLGFRALPVCILTLIMNSVPVSFGAVGTPTWYGFSPLSAFSLSDNFFVEVASKTAFIHVIAALIIPVIALRFVVSWNEIRKNLVFIYVSIFACVVPYLLIAQVNDEFPSLVGGAIGLLVSALVAKTGFGISKDYNYEESNVDVSTKSVSEAPALEAEDKYTTKDVLKAFFPFFVLIGILIITRLKQLPFKAALTNGEALFTTSLGFSDFSLTKSLTFSFTNIFGTTVGDKYQLLYVPALIPFVVTVLLSGFLFRTNLTKISGIFSQSAKDVRLTYVALFGAFVMVKLMMLSTTAADGTKITSMVTTIGTVFSNSFGDYWLYLASYLGAVGAFFSGSNTVSNLTFGSIQYDIANSIQQSPTTILAMQSVGGAMGNMICLNNIIAVCTVTHVVNKEGFIIKRTIIPCVIYGIIAALVVKIGMSINFLY